MTLSAAVSIICDMRENWSKIIEWHRELLAEWGMDNAYARDVAGVTAVAEHINQTWLRDCLFGTTSMHGIWISQTDIDVYLTNSPHLRIEPLTTGGVRFRYVDSFWGDRKDWPLNREKQWQRVVTHDQTVPRFNRFLDQLRWVSPQNAKALAASAPPAITVP